MSELVGNFMQHLRSEYEHGIGSKDGTPEDYRAPVRKVYFTEGGVNGHAPVVAETDDEAVETFRQIIEADGGDPEEYEISKVYPRDDVIEQLSPLMQSHLKRAPSRRRQGDLEDAIESAEEELAKEKIAQ